MSSLLDNLADPNYRPPRGPECGVSILLTELKPDQAKSLQAAMANPHAPSTAISKAVADLGHRCSSHVIQRHRRGECRCSQ
jgi:hypothetical protein